MADRRFEELAAELCARDRDLAVALRHAREHLGALREQARTQVAAFVAAVHREGSHHLADLAVGPLEPDEKHVDCLQFKVRRGRWEIVAVAKPKGTVTLVGPYRLGKPERPCRDHTLPSEEAQGGLAELLLALIREASAR
jgi:hypothetical protein